MKRTDIELNKGMGRKKPIAALLVITLLVTCASFVSSEGNENLNTFLPQNDATFDPYDPLDAIGDGEEGGLGVFLGEGEDAGDENSADANTGEGKEEGTGEGGADGQEVGEVGENTDPADVDGSPSVNYPAALKPPTTSQGATADTEGATPGAIDEAGTSGAITGPDGILVTPPDTDPPQGVGIPPTEGGIFFAPELEAENPAPGETEEEADKAEALEALEAVAITTYAAVNTLEIELNTLNQNLAGPGWYYNHDPQGGWLVFSGSDAEQKRYVLKGDSVGLRVLFYDCSTEVSLENVNMRPNGSSGCFKLMNGAHLKLRLQGQNVIEGSTVMPGGYSIDSEAGINVPRGTTLEIFGPGRLEVTGGEGSAAIGGSAGSDHDDQMSNCGRVVVHSGALKAFATPLQIASFNGGGAAIGGSMKGYGGQVEIRGGRLDLWGSPNPIGQGICDTHNPCADGNESNIVMSSGIEIFDHAQGVGIFSLRQKTTNDFGEYLHPLLVKTKDLSGTTPAPGVELEIKIHKGTQKEYIYRAVTDSAGEAYCWVPNVAISKDDIIAVVGPASFVAEHGVSQGRDSAAADVRETEIRLNPNATVTNGTVIIYDHLHKKVIREVGVAAINGVFDVDMRAFTEIGFAPLGHYLEGNGNEDKMILSETGRYPNSTFPSPLPQNFRIVYEYMDADVDNLFDVNVDQRPLAFYVDTTCGPTRSPFITWGGIEAKPVPGPLTPTFQNNSPYPVRIWLQGVEVVDDDGVAFEDSRDQYGNVVTPRDISIWYVLKLGPNAYRGGGRPEAMRIGGAYDDPSTWIDKGKMAEKGRNNCAYLEMQGIWHSATLPADRPRYPKLKFHFRFEITSFDPHTNP
jgi:hypothetical protein